MHFSLSIAVAGCLASLAFAVPALKPRDGPPKFPYGYEKVRGVNLGGWFVLEPWITPSLFDEVGGAAVDEWTFCSVLGASEAQKRLYNHWYSWITQGDFQAIAAAGMNHVRIPIGYWSVTPIQGEPYVQGAYDVLGQALDWAAGAGLKVMIDLHGAPGSQNGFDNSGRRGAINWQTGSTVDQTKNALNKIRDDHASHPAVATIELLNEPFGSSLDMNGVRQFYMDGWGNLENSGVTVTFHDAFQPLSSWNSWGSGMWNLMLDTHHYEVFDTSTLVLSPTDHVKNACSFGGQMRGVNKPTISGEWTGAMTDCAKYLNGYGRGARYDGSYGGSTAIGSCAGYATGSVGQLSQQQRDDVAKFINAQLDAFESAAGWIFWTWKTEGAPGWDMGDLLSNGVFPNPVTSRQFPGQCG